jgi:apolipoprotein N-acyltransferase
VKSPLPVVVDGRVQPGHRPHPQRPAKTDASIRVTFVQPAVPQTMIWDTTENTNRFNQLIALTKTALTSETELLLWPEAALPELNDDTLCHADESHPRAPIRHG